MRSSRNVYSPVIDAGHKSNRLGMSIRLAMSTTTMRIMRIGVAPTTSLRGYMVNT